MSATAICLFGSFFLLLFLNMPIAVALGLSTAITLLLFDLPIQSLPPTLYSSLTKFTLLAIPFFFLAGLIMERAGISKRLIQLAQTLTGHFTGGLAIVSVVAACFFAAISGSGPATMAAVGAIIIPAMVKQGYRKDMSAGLLATAGGIGIIIPPSIAYIIYGVIAEVSIGKIFMAGIVPGLLMGAILALTGYMIARKEQIPTLPKASARDIVAALKDASWGLMAPVIILGGIYTGIFTPTESAVVAVFYGLFVGIFIYKEIKIKHLPSLLVESAKTTAMIMLIVASASTFAWLITVEGIAEDLANSLMSIAPNTITMMLMINLVLLIAGMFVDAISAFYIFLPIFLPILTMMDIDPVHFGVMMTMNLAIGLVTPPVGLDLYVACGLAKISLKEISKGVIPFIVASILALLVITYIPSITLWLPELLNMK
ncbi:TRAP transporter large permease [Brevibacillus borstelensis]|jgi:C4-dicarboxylate transporter, DctM subunit|uniref:TRAP transporter large permease n=1 Tax=Brevibacillus TaxID=55080 RepID=UPI000F087C03|nr:TRAP transporter large permease [Brevibacillus borstelensis]MBE5396889.1 TRAP transporter large permease [Brevibacillus borstelensis]MCM3591719.1 TRAP transporter large permease [Brevibacillus borstelensis]MED1875123.1 TRAP transporter large permease [Brevibacillus borstelensis]MED1884184.1 TRAP transporter large permease [Brevibacillus borstelensis]RNB64153.1 TRAP transporter large permease [Brevibacillus borstelensis]